MPSNPVNPRVEFTPADVLRLEVETLTDPVNLVQNPSGDLGIWWWSTDDAASISVHNYIGDPSNYIEVRNTDVGALVRIPVTLVSGYMPVTPSDYIAAEITVGGVTSGYNVKAWLEFVDEDRDVVSTTSKSTGITTAGTYDVFPAYSVPSGAAYVRLHLGLYSGTLNPLPGSACDFTVQRVAVAKLLSDPLDFVEPYSWTDILDSGASLTIQRAALDVGTLTATLSDPALDPAVSSVIAHGRRLRVLALTTPPEGGAAVWEPIFTGRIEKASTTYQLDKASPDGVRPVVTVVAHDALTELANITQPVGVDDLDELLRLFGGSPVPFLIEGRNDVNTPIDVVQVSYNPQASLIDQVAVYRDVRQIDVPGLYAIVTRDGVLKLDDADSYPGLTYDGTYSNVVVDYDTTRLINSINIKWQRNWEGVGDSQQANYGPFVDQNSIDRFGAYSATFTLHGSVESYPDIRDYAEATLAANSTPARQVTAMTVPVLTAADVTRAVHSDLANRVEVVTDVLTSTVQVEAITHRITPAGWLVDYAFSNPTANPAPQAVPSPVAPGTEDDDPRVPHPYSMATGTRTVTLTAVQSNAAAVTFPTGRFTQPPALALANVGGTGSSAAIVQASGPPTTSGFTLLVVSKDIGTNITATVTVHWTAIQMTESSGFG